MISELSSHAKVPARFAQAPWNEHTAFCVNSMSSYPMIILLERFETPWATLT